MRQIGTFPQPFNYEVTIEGMLDARMLVPSLADLLTFTEGNYLPNGFLVSVFDGTPSNRGLYQLIDNTDLGNINSWRRIDGIDGNNGLSKTGNYIQLGGSLIKNTTIDTTGYSLDIQANPNGLSSELYFTDTNVTFGNSYINSLEPLIVTTAQVGFGSGVATFGISSQSGLGATQLVVDSVSAIFRDTYNSTGLLYEDDYSAIGVTKDRWIPDWATVKLYGTTANNGLTKTSNNIQLGGVLTDNTNISIDSFNFSISNTSHKTELAITDTYTSLISGDTNGSIDGSYSGVYADKNQAGLEYVVIIGGQSYSSDIILGNNNAFVGMLVRDSLNSKGLTYLADYSLNGTLDDRWIPDWGAVKNFTNTNAEQFLGVIYSKNNFVNLTDFTDVSSGATINSGYISFATGSGNNTFIKQLQVNGSTVLKKYKFSTTFIVDEKSSTSYGIAIGTQSTYSGPGKINIAGKFDMTSNAGSGQVSIVGGDITNLYPTLSTSTTSISFSVGDTIELVFERYMNKFIVSARNVSTSSAYVSTTTTMTYNGSAGIYQPNMGQFSLYNLGGAFRVSDIKINSRQVKNPRLLLFTDSKGEFGTRFITTNVATYLGIANNSTVLESGRGNTTIDMLALLPEIISIKPKIVVISCSSNDIRGGTIPLSTTQANYQTITNTLVSSGITVYHTLPLYEPGLDQTAMEAWLIATYPSSYIRVPIVSTDLVDGTHLNESGMFKWYNAIIDSGFIQIGEKNEAFKFILDQSNTLLTGLTGSQTVYGGFNSGENLTLSSTFNSTKGSIYIGSAQTTSFDEVNSRLLLRTTTGANTLTIGNSGNGLAIHNLSTTSTNAEYLEIKPVSNVFTIQSNNLGTGVQRDLKLSLLNGRAFTIHATPTTAGTFEFAGGTSGTGAVIEVTGTYTAATSRQWFIGAAPTISQTGTAGSSIIYAYPFYNTVGSGLDYFLDFGTSTASNLGGTLTPKFRVDRNGVLTLGTWNGVVIDPVYGGTGQSGYTIGDILSANSAIGLTKISDVAVGNVLLSGGTGTLPLYGKVTSSHIDSTIPTIAGNNTFSGSSNSFTNTVNLNGATNLNGGGNFKSGFGASFYNTGNTFAAQLLVPSLTANRAINIPDISGTMALLSDIAIGGIYSDTVTAQSTFTVSIGSTLANTNYKVVISPDNALSAVSFYINNKTTTTFDIVVLSPLTGTISFEWILVK